LLDVPSGQGPCWPCVPPSWPRLTRQALLREPARRHVSQDRGRWPQQATGGCKLGHTMMQAPQLRSACPSRGDTPHPASPWPHRLTSLTSARATTAPRRFLRVLLSVFSKSFRVRGNCAEQALRKRRRRLGRGPAGPCTLSTFLHKFAWKCVEAIGLNQPAEGDEATYVKGLGTASGLRGLGLRPRPDPYHELRPLPCGAHALVVVEDAMAPWALHPANVVEPEAPRPEDPELALVAAVRALDQAVPLSLPVSLALKRFQPGLRGLEVIALLRRITTALGRASPQPTRKGTLTYKDV